MIFPESEPVLLPLDLLDPGDAFFKISRNVIDESLSRSIGEYGVLSPPVLTREGEGYRVIAGHNRLRVLRDLGKQSVEALLVPAVSGEDFLGHLLLKGYRKELGPLGAIRGLAILRDRFAVPREKLVRIGAEGFGLPRDFVEGEAWGDRALSLPQALRDYCDMRDVALKTLRLCLRLPAQAHEALARWTLETGMRLNIFKGIIEMLGDINNRDGNLDFLKHLSPPPEADRRRLEEFYHDEVFRNRYPDYTTLKDAIDPLVASLACTGIEAKVPRYLEDQRVTLQLVFSSSDDETKMREKLQDINTATLKKILDLL